MRIRFTYDDKRRSGKLERLYTAQNGNVIAKVLEDGGEHAKSFRMDRMNAIESGPVLTNEEMMPLLLEAARWLAPIGYSGNPLELLVAAAYITRSADVLRKVSEALDHVNADPEAEGLEVTPK